MGDLAVKRILQLVSLSLPVFSGGRNLHGNATPITNWLLAGRAINALCRATTPFLNKNALNNFLCVPNNVAFRSAATIDRVISKGSLNNQAAIHAGG
jgi:hypothetical protein